MKTPEGTFEVRPPITTKMGKGSKSLGGLKNAHEGVRNEAERFKTEGGGKGSEGGGKVGGKEVCWGLEIVSGDDPPDPQN